MTKKTDLLTNKNY